MNTFIRVSLIFFIFLGILQQPYSYYDFLRIYTCMGSIYLIVDNLRHQTQNRFIFIYLGIAILFNPIFPIYLSKDSWILIDIVSVLFLGISLALDKNVNNKQSKSS